MLQSQNHKLRAMEISDLPLLMELENHSEEWWLGANIAPISSEALKRYIVGDHDLYRDQQMRLILESSNKAVGAFDLYDLNPRNRRAGVGLAIAPVERGNGHAAAGLSLLVDYAFQHLSLHQLWAEIPSKNEQSVHLFQKAGFEFCGTLKDWIWDGHEWVDAILMQCVANIMSK